MINPERMLQIYIIALSKVLHSQPLDVEHAKLLIKRLSDLIKNKSTQTDSCVIIDPYTETTERSEMTATPLPEPFDILKISDDVDGNIEYVNVFTTDQMTAYELAGFKRGLAAARPFEPAENE